MSIIHIPPPEAETDNSLIVHPDAARLRHLPIQAPKSEGRDLDLIDCLSRRWILALVLFLTVGFFGSIWTIRHINQTYQAEAMVYISPDLAKDQGGEISESSYRTLINQQILTILSNDTLRPAVVLLAATKVRPIDKAETENKVLGELRSRLEVHPVPDSYEVSVRATSVNPQNAAEVANVVARSYVDQESRLGNAGSGSTTAALMEEKANLEARLQEKLELRGRLSETLEVINPGEGSVLPQDEVLRRIRESLITVHNQRLEAEANLAKGVLTNQSDANASPSTMSKSALLQRQRELRERIKGLLPAHPIRKQIESELAEVDDELQTNSASDTSPRAEAVSSLRAQIDADRQIEERLSQDLANQTSSIPLQAKSVQEIQLVNAVILRIQGQLNQIEERIEDIQLRRIAGSIRIFSPAEVPEKPLKNQKMKILIAMWVSALLLSLVVPVAFDLFDDRVYHSTDVERTLGVPVIGISLRRRRPELDKFADEQIARVAGSLARGITGEFGVRNLFVSMLKRETDPLLLKDLAYHLSQYGIEATVTSANSLIGPSPLLTSGGHGSAMIDRHEVTMISGPAFLFSAEAERFASESDLTLLVIEAGFDTRADLVQCANVLTRVNIPNLRIMISEIELERGGRALKSQVKDYLAVQERLS